MFALRVQGRLHKGGTFALDKWRNFQEIKKGKDRQATEKTAIVEEMKDEMEEIIAISGNYSSSVWLRRRVTFKDT